MKNIIIIILLFNLISGHAQNDTCLNNLSLGIAFPPVKDETQRLFTKTHLDFLGVSKIQFSEDWAFREPAKGHFNWEPLDKRINWAYENGYEVLLTIPANAPDWACSSTQNSQSCVFIDNRYFKTYIDPLLQRYPDTISKMQFGNDCKSDYWCVESASYFIKVNNILYSSVQTYAPSTQVVLGGFTTISLRFLVDCNGCVDSFCDDDGVYYDTTYLTANCSNYIFQITAN